MSDTLRTHIRGVLSRRPEWSDSLASFEAEAAWIIGDWATVDSAKAPPIAKVLLGLHKRRDMGPIFRLARSELGQTITSKQYTRAYDQVLQLHMLREIEVIHDADRKISGVRDKHNPNVIRNNIGDDLVNHLRDRFQATSPAFRVHEALLSIRRTAFNLVNTPILKLQTGHAWIESAKIARKAGYAQTAYSATLQAIEADAPFAFIQQAKLVHDSGGAFKALTELENTVAPMLKIARPAGSEPDFARDRGLGKVRGHSSFEDECAEDRLFCSWRDGLMRRIASPRMMSSNDSSRLLGLRPSEDSAVS